MRRRKEKTKLVQAKKRGFWRTEPREKAIGKEVAEREGFEPSIGVNLYSLSRGALSTTQPSLRAEMQLGEACLRGQAVIG